MSESVLPMFSSGSFIVSGLTFRSLIHFELSQSLCKNVLDSEAPVSFLYLRKRVRSDFGEKVRGQVL